MEPQSLILGVLIAGLAVVIVLWPFVSTRREDAAFQPVGPTRQAETLAAERDAIYATIRDLDFDFETGKLTDEDYRAQREAWVERGVNVLKALDALQGSREPAPAPARSAYPPAGDPVIPAGRPAASLNGDLESRIEAAVAERRRTTA